MISTDSPAHRAPWQIPPGIIAATFVVGVGRHVNVRLCEDFFQHAERVFDSRPDLEHNVGAALGTLGPLFITWLLPRLPTWSALVASCGIMSLTYLLATGEGLLIGFVYGAHTFLLVLPVFQDVRAVRLSSKLPGTMALGSAALYSFWAVTVPAVVYMAGGRQWMAAVAFALALPVFALYVRGLRQAHLDRRHELKRLALRTLHLPFLFFAGEITVMYSVIVSSG